MSDPFLYEFLYRGRPANDPQPPAWHAIVGQYIDLPGTSERQFVSSSALTPEQAEAAGYPLPAILNGINAVALASADAARAEAADLRRERDGLLAQLAALQTASSQLAVSDRQFFQALAQAGTITEDEALAAVMTGTLPKKIEAAVKSLPADQQFAARMLLSGATTFERGHPMVAQLGAALGYDDAGLDALWKAAAAL